MSHLSDVQCAGNTMNEKDVNERMNFVKHIILHTKGDLNKQIDPDELWNSFKGMFPDDEDETIIGTF
ncbi:MAG: hypothetical protein PF487_09030 [Bacteroidales bacterium]|nr:hypothetical protein [Bacteroidales bacterium]